MQSLSK